MNMQCFRRDRILYKPVACAVKVKEKQDYRLSRKASYGDIDGYVLYSLQHLTMALSGLKSD